MVPLPKRPVWLPGSLHRVVEMSWMNAFEVLEVLNWFFEDCWTGLFNNFLKSISTFPGKNLFQDCFFKNSLQDWPMSNFSLLPAQFLLTSSRRLDNPLSLFSSKSCSRQRGGNSVPTLYRINAPNDIEQFGFVWIKQFRLFNLEHFSAHNVIPRVTI